MIKPKHLNFLRDALANVGARSGASDEYCRGAIVAIAGVLLAYGYSFPQAFALMQANLPADARDAARYLPESWWAA